MKKPGKPVCAHYVASYLPLTENWIYRVLINHRAYDPVMLSRRKENLSLFPIPKLFSLSDLPKVRQYAELVFFRTFGYFFFMNAVCRREQVNILHIHFGYHGVKSIGLRKKLRVPMVCSFYGDDAFSHPLNPGVTEKYQRLFASADKVLVLGPYMKEALIRLGCDARKLVIHHLGIDVASIAFRPRRWQAGQRMRFLIASSFVEKKGIDLAVRALARFKDQYDFTLDIIGDGKLRPMIEKAIGDSGLSRRVTLHGYKPYDYFIQMASQCDVFIQASKTGERNNKEGTPMAIVDAMATGMAVISTRHSDIPEIVHEGVHGYLADEGDEGSLADCIRKMLEHPEQLASFSEAGRAHVEEQFDARKQTAILEQYYDELLQGNGINS
jgi:colanic acid/amylovoran biosynthesis glycosyltransferase